MLIDKRFKAGIDGIKKEEKCLKLSNYEIKTIIEYINFNFKFLTSTLRYPLEIPKSKTGLPRSITLLSPGDILLISSSKKDALLGKGARKKFKIAIDLISGKFYACAKRTSYYKDEILKRQTLATTCENVARIVSITEKRVIEQYYHSSLVDVIQELSFEKKLALLPSIFKTVKSLHDQGLIHRDIKPQNFLVKKDPALGYQIYISDFEGIVMKNLIRYPDAFGTLGFMSSAYQKSLSERDFLKSSLLTNEKLDIYALGKTVYQLFEDDFIDLKKTFFLFKSLSKKIQMETLIFLINKMTDETEDDRASWKEIIPILMHLHTMIPPGALKQPFPIF